MTFLGDHADCIILHFRTAKNGRWTSLPLMFLYGILAELQLSTELHFMDCRFFSGVIDAASYFEQNHSTGQ